MTKYLYHISLEGDINEEKIFTPRVPNTCMQDEENTIPRICTSETIRGCIAAFPYRRDLDEVVDNGSGFLYLYKFDMYSLGSNNLKYFYQIEKYVPDAVSTKETWITKEVKSKAEIIRIDKLGNISYSQSNYDRVFRDIIYKNGDYVNEILSYNVDPKYEDEEKYSILYTISKDDDCEKLWNLIAKNHNCKYHIMHQVNDFNKSLYEVFQ